MARAIRSALLVFAFASLLAGDAVTDVVIRGGRQIPTTGYINPTISTFNGSHPLVHCSSSCGASLVNQNTDALQAAFDAAATGVHPWIYLPRGEYPIARGGSSHNQLYGVLVTGKSHIVLVGDGAVIRETGAITGTYEMLNIVNSSDIRIVGVTFSQRDDSTVPPAEQNHMIQLGSGTNTGNVDNVQIVNSTFIEGKGGDPIRFLGGNNLDNLVTRVAIHENLIDGKRTALSFQHGTAMINAVSNMMGPNCTDQLIDHEPTSNGGNNFFNAIGNHLARPSGRNAPLVTLGGNSAGDELSMTAYSTVFAYNEMPNGEMQALDIYQTWMIGNEMATHSANSKPVLYFFRQAVDTWIEDNKISSDTDADDITQQILFESNSGQCPTTGWIRNNTFDQYDPGGTAINVTAKDTFIEGNRITNHNANTSFNGIIARGAPGDGSAELPSSGYISENTVRKASGAGNIAVALSCGTDGNINTSGFCRVRDNIVKDAASFFQATQVTLPEGLPVISGNQMQNVTNTGLNLPKWATDTTSAFEVVSSGSLSVSRRTTRANGTCASQSLTLPDGVRDGFVKTVIAPKGPCTTTTTITPTHFGDGTSVSWTSSSSSTPVWVSFVWDASDATWRTIDYSSNVTVNP